MYASWIHKEQLKYCHDQDKKIIHFTKSAKMVVDCVGSLSMAVSKCNYFALSWGHSIKFFYIIKESLVF